MDTGCSWITTSYQTAGSSGFSDIRNNSWIQDWICGLCFAMEKYEFNTGKSLWLQLLQREIPPLHVTSRGNGFAGKVLLRHIWKGVLLLFSRTWISVNSNWSDLQKYKPETFKVAQVSTYNYKTKVIHENL